MTYSDIERQVNNQGVCDKDTLTHAIEMLSVYREYIKLFNSPVKTPKDLRKLRALRKKINADQEAIK